MANTIVQQNTAATSVNSPTSVTPTLGGASTAGNFLFMTVVVTGTSPSITTPASWTLVTGASNATFAIAMFSRPNNPGGITSVAITISATNGGAVATIYEFGGIGVAPTTDLVQSLNFSGTGLTGSQTTPPADLGELEIIVMGVVATSVISTSSQGSFTIITGPTSSTVATTNAQKIDYISLNIPTQDTGLTNSVTGGAQNIAFAQARYITASSTPLNRGGVNGGIYVGTVNNPAGSLQVPQPIAPGNFGSGTTGSF